MSPAGRRDVVTDQRHQDEHPLPFLDWIENMESAEMQVHPEDRVYLVISRLRRVRKAKGKLGFLQNVSTTFGGLAGGSLNATKAVSGSTIGSSNSKSREHGEVYEDLGQDIKEAWESLSLFLGLRKPPAKQHNTQRSSSPRARLSSDSQGRRKPSRGSSRTPSVNEKTDRSPSNSWSSSSNSEQEKSERAEKNHVFTNDNVLCVTDKNAPWRDRLGLSEVVDHHEQDLEYWAKQHPRHYSGSSSYFSKKTKGIAQCHWAIEYRGRYFELQVRKLPHAYQLKEFAFFSSASEVEMDERDILGRVYAGCSHMSSEVIDEIGKGIMKTQPVYELRSDNCQQFIAVFLPRILCSRHPYMPCLPCGSVPWAQKYTTFPTYVVGVRQGELTAIDHRYYTLTSGLHMLIKHFDKMKDKEKKDLWDVWRGEPQVDFQSTEISKYTFRLQGDDPTVFVSCRPIWDNPYLLVHREHKKTDLRPLGNLEVTENNFHLWPKNRALDENPLLDQLEQAAAIQNGKKLLGSLDLFKTQLWRDVATQAQAQQ